MKNICALLSLFFGFLFTISVQAQTFITFVPSNAGLIRPAEMAFDHSGNLYVINNYLNGTSSVSKVTPDASVSTFVPANAGLNLPRGIACDASDNVYISVIDGIIYKVTPAGVMSVFINSGLDYPTDMAFDAYGNLFVSNSRPPFYINKVTPGGVVSIFVQNGMNYPAGLNFDSEGNLFVANVANFQNGYISEINPDGGVSTFAKAGLYDPAKLAFDAHGNMFVTDIDNQGVLLKITPDGTVSGFLSSGLGGPYAVALGPSGNLYIGDNTGNRILEVLQSALPLFFTSFNAIFNNHNVELKWHTDAEHNTSHFIVQHSTNGNSFSDIGTVRAVSSGANNYSFSDEHYFDGANYYRLKTVGIDGKFSYSKIINIKITQQIFTLSPNPAADFAILDFKGPPEQSEISVYTTTGRKVINEIVKSPGNNYKLNLQLVGTGIYIVRVKTGNASYQQKLVIKK